MRRHPLDLASLATAFLYVAALAAWIAFESDSVDGANLLVAGPIALIVLGIVGVVATVRRPRTGAARTEPEQVPEQTGTTQSTEIIDHQNDDEGPLT